MTTRAILADDTTFDYDEETQAHPTHVNDQPVVRRVFTGPTPPPSAGAPAGETAAQKRDRLRAELAALDDDEPAGTGGVFPPVA
jgi:hypothetical protein